MKRKQKFKNNDLAWSIIERNLRGFIRKSKNFDQEEVDDNCDGNGVTTPSESHSNHDPKLQQSNRLTYP